MERSFARGTRYGFDRARWRGLWRVRIQEYVIAAVQNIRVLLTYGNQPNQGMAAWVNGMKGASRGAIIFFAFNNKLNGRRTQPAVASGSCYL